MKTILIFAVLFTVSTAVAAADPPARPNIIFILGDDVGLGNISCYGGHFKTPHIDALASSGVRFEHCYASPLCGPSRAACLTGRYGFRTGMVANESRASSHTDEIMIPRVLKPAGYVSVLIGKWSRNWLEPDDWGFDETLYTKGGGNYWADQASTYTRNGAQEALGDRYFPDVMHDGLVDFITRHKDRPFFAFYSLAQMHAKIQRTPDSKPDGSDFYADNNAYMDQLVGQLVAALDDLQLRERTVIVFTGDNGTSSDGASAATVNGRAISGKKSSMLEGGSRVPLIVSWPGTGPAGRVLKDLTDFTDFLPSFAELAGAPLPQITIDGRSWTPRLRGLAGKPRDWVFVQLGERRYVRDGRWKLTGDNQLFDLTEAPFKEIAVRTSSDDPEAIRSRRKLQSLLDELRTKDAAHSN